VRDVSRCSPVAESLDERALVALQLLARGYTPAQIAGLREVSRLDVLRDLARAFRHLDAATAHEAIKAARRRGLIV
jgi:DNA-binding CsgD family transcriptional regulator